MRHVVIGASGTIGHQLLAEARARSLAIVGTGLARADGSLRRFDARSDRLTALLPDLSPADCVYVLAAFTEMDWVARNREAAHDLNVRATRALIDEAVARGARVIFLSTDQVFDGQRGGYTEDEPVSPLNAYGAQKAEVERHLLRVGGRSCIVRTGWNVGWRRGDHCPVVNTYRTLLRPGARMAADNVITVTDVRDTSRILLALAEREAAGIYHVVSSPPITRAALAELVMDHSRNRARMAFEKVAFDDLRFAEERPRKSWLANGKVVREVGARFGSPDDVVAAKTRLIDEWGEDA